MVTMPTRRMMTGTVVSAAILALTAGLFLGMMTGGGYGSVRSSDGSKAWRGTDDKRTVLVESALLWYDGHASPTNAPLGRLLELADRGDALDRTSIRSARSLMRDAASAAAPTGSAEVWWAPAIAAQHETFGTVTLRSANAGATRGEATLEVSPSMLKETIIRVGCALNVQGEGGDDRFESRSWITLDDGTGLLLDLGPIDNEGCGSLMLLLSAKKITG